MFVCPWLHPSVSPSRNPSIARIGTCSVTNGEGTVKFNCSKRTPPGPGGKIHAFRSVLNYSTWRVLVTSGLSYAIVPEGPPALRVLSSFKILIFQIDFLKKIFPKKKLPKKKSATVFCEKHFFERSIWKINFEKKIGFFFWNVVKFFEEKTNNFRRIFFVDKN